MGYEWRVFMKESNDGWDSLEEAPMTLFSKLETDLPAATAAVKSAPGERRTDLYYDIEREMKWGLKERHVTPESHVLLELKVLLGAGPVQGQTTSGEPIHVEQWSKVLATPMTAPVPSLKKIRMLRRPRIKTVYKQMPRLLKEHRDIGSDVNKVWKEVKKARKSLKEQRKAAVAAKNPATSSNDKSKSKSKNKNKNKKKSPKVKKSPVSGSTDDDDDDDDGESSSSSEDEEEGIVEEGIVEEAQDIQWSFDPLVPVLVDKLRKQVSLVRGDGKRRSSLGRAMTNIKNKLGASLPKDGWVAKSYWVPTLSKSVKVEEAVIWVTVLDGKTKTPSRTAWRSWCVEGGDPEAIADFVRGVVLPHVATTTNAPVYAGYPEFVAQRLE